jgi:hypothetical protein
MLFCCVGGWGDVLGWALAFPPQNKGSEYCAPLTSFDWNDTDPTMIGTSSIDTTCTIWDITVRAGAMVSWVVVAAPARARVT